MALALSMLCTAVRAEPGDPRPDELGSHEYFRTRLEESQAASYQQFLALYDRWLEAHPDSARAALERCRFVMSSATDSDDTDGEDFSTEGREDCSAQLVQRFPEVASVMQFRMDQLWGEEAVQYGEAVLAKRSLEWGKTQQAPFLKSLAFAFFSQGELSQAVYAAEVARKLDPALDLSIIFANEYKRQGRTREATSAIAAAGVGDSRHAYQKLSLLLECNAFQEALTFIDAMQRAQLPVATLQHAQALEGVGRTEAARKLYASLTDQQWNRERGLSRLLYIDLSGNDRKRAIASYEALRDVGFHVDPFLRHRLALALKFPSAPWHLRDGLGLLGLLGFGLCLLALPCLVIFPVHYIGLVRQSRAQTALPPPERWSLRQFWGVSAGYLAASVCASYLFSYAELATIFAETPVAEPTRAEIARSTFWNSIVTSLAVLLWLRRGDFARLFRSQWSPQRIAWSTLGWTIVVLLVQGMALGILRAFGWSPSESVSLALGLTTREALTAALSAYGPWLFLPAVVVLVPVAEELLFRSVCLTSTVRYLPFRFANALQASLFTLLHDEPARYPALFSLAWIAGRLTQRSGGLLPAVCLHMTINLLATLAISAGLGTPPADAAPKPPEGAFKALNTDAMLELCQRKDAPRCSDAAEREEHAAHYARAVTLYRDACDLGLASACIRLGVRYANGVHVERDRARAAPLLERACQLGAGGGCNQRAVLHEEAAELQQAVQLYTKACDLDRLEGCSNLARFYRDGTAVTQDYIQAMRLFKLACEGGIDGACDALHAR